MSKAALLLVNFNGTLLLNKIISNLEKNFKLTSDVIIPNIDLTKFYDRSRDQYLSTRFIEYALLNYGS